MFAQTTDRYLIALYLSLSNRSDEGLTLDTSAFKLLRWPIYVINSVDNTKLHLSLRYIMIEVRVTCHTCTLLTSYQTWNLKSYRYWIDCLWYFVFRCFQLYLQFLIDSLNPESFLHKWEILHSKNCFKSSKSTHWSSLGSLPFGGDSRIVKINIARRTGICFRCACHHPVCSPSSVDMFLFDGYKLTPPRVWQERISNKTDKRPILRLLGYYERMLAVCKTIGCVGARICIIIFC